MKNMSFSRIVIPMMVVCLVLALGGSAVGQGPGTRPCSNRTLFGDYGTLIEGTLLAPNWPLRTVAMIHFDGRGNMTSVDHVVLNGMPPRGGMEAEQRDLHCESGLHRISSILWSDPGAFRGCEERQGVSWSSGWKCHHLARLQS